jgi:hypothetical protein
VQQLQLQRLLLLLLLLLLPLLLSLLRDALALQSQASYRLRRQVTAT